MFILPEGAFTVIPDKVEEKTAGGIILDSDSKKIPDTGIIVYTSKDLEEYQGFKVRYRENFSEAIDIKGIIHLYFRDFKSSIYYIIEDD